MVVVAVVVDSFLGNGFLENAEPALVEFVADDAVGERIQAAGETDVAVAVVVAIVENFGLYGCYYYCSCYYFGIVQGTTLVGVAFL